MIDLSGLRMILGVFLGIVLALGAVGVVVKLATGIVSVRGQNYGEGAMNIAIALVGGVIIGYALPWVATLTGITLSVQQL